MASITIKNLYDDISSVNKALTEANKTMDKINTNGNNVHAIDRCPLCGKNQIGIGNNGNDNPSSPVSKDVYAANVITDPNRRFITDELLEKINIALDLYMREDIYDTNNNSIVDLSERAFIADTVEWDNITNKPNINIGGLEEAVKNIHIHTNKTAIDMIGYDPSNENAPLWNGKDWPHPISASNSIELDIPAIRNIIIDYDIPHNSKTGDIWIQYNRSSDTIESINVKNEDGGWFNLNIGDISNNITNVIISKLNEIIDRRFVTDHEDLNNLQGGNRNTNEYYHITEDEYKVLQRIENDYLNGDFETEFSKSEYLKLIEIINKFNDNLLGKQFTDQEYLDIKSVIRDYLLGKLTEKEFTDKEHNDLLTIINQYNLGSFDKEFTIDQKSSIIKMLNDYLSGRFVCKFTDVEKNQLTTIINNYLSGSLSQSFTNQEFQQIKNFVDNYLNNHKDEPFTTNFKNNLYTSLREFITIVLSKTLTNYEFENLRDLIDNYLNELFNHNFSNEEITTIRTIIVEYLNNNLGKQFTDNEKSKIKDIINDYINNKLVNPDGYTISSTDYPTLLELLRKYRDNAICTCESVETEEYDNGFADDVFNIIDSIDYDGGFAGTIDYEIELDGRFANWDSNTGSMNPGTGSVVKQFTDNEATIIREVINKYINNELGNNSSTNKQFTDNEASTLRTIIEKYIRNELTGNTNAPQFTNDQVTKIISIINDYVNNKLVNPDGYTITNNDYPIFLELLNKYKNNEICTCEKVEIETEEYDNGYSSFNTDVEYDGGFAGTTDYEAELDGQFAGWNTSTGGMPSTGGSSQFNTDQLNTLLKMINKYDRLEYLYDQFNRSEYQTLLDMIDDYLNESIASLSDEQLQYLQQTLAYALNETLKEELKNMSVTFKQFNDTDYRTIMSMISDYRNGKLTNNITTDESTLLKQIIGDYNSGKLTNNQNWLVRDDIVKLINDKIDTLTPGGSIDQLVLNNLKADILSEVDKKLEQFTPNTTPTNGHYLTDDEYNMFTQIMNDYKLGNLTCKCNKPGTSDDETVDIIDNVDAYTLISLDNYDEYDGGFANTTIYQSDIDAFNARIDVLTDE